MSNDHANPSDPLGFVRNMWGNMGFSLPGMVTPTFDVDELGKRIQDLKAVEGWLRMNLSMLQATIQGLEMQVTTLTAMKNMGNMAANAAQSATQAPGQTPPPSAAPDLSSSMGISSEAAGALSQAAMWPWQLMQQMQEQLQQQSDAVKAQSPKPAPKKPRTRKNSSQG